MAAGRLEHDETVSAEHLAQSPARAPSPAVDETLPSEPPAPTGEPGELPPIDPRLYERDREIARGGMGRIVAARDRRLGRFVAIKELLPGRDGLRRRFAREARIAARLQHPSIVPVHEGGVWPDGQPFYAMKLVVGESLEAALAARPTLAARLALLPNVIAVCDALAYAHSQRVVHRDLKPHNVVLGEFGETVVVDWGLAKELGAAAPAEPESQEGGEPSGPDSTRAGSVLGTPAYMAPEQARGEPVDERADVYALGAILYRLVAGAPPFAGDSATKLVEAAGAARVRPLAEREPACPPELAAVVDKAMAADGGRRYPHAGQLVADLKRFQTGQLVGAHQYSTGDLVRRWLRRHRTAVSVGGVLVAVLVAVSAIAALRIVAERDSARRERSVAESERRVADAQRRGAEKLVDYMMSSLRGKLEAIGRLDALLGVSSSVLDYYESVGASADAETLDRRAEALLVLGDAEDEAGGTDASVRAYKDALAMRDRLATLAPTDDKNEFGRVRLEQRLAVAAYRGGRLAEARAGETSALAKLGPLLDRHPDDQRMASGFAILVQELSDCDRDLGDIPAALALLETARRQAARLTSPLALIETDLTMANLQELAGQHAAAQGSLAIASATAEAWAAGAPRDARALQPLLRARLDEGEAKVDADAFAAGERAYRRAVAVGDALVGLDEKNAHNRWLLSKAHNGLALALQGLGRAADGIAAARRAVEIREALVVTEPESPLWQKELTNAQDRLGMLLVDAGRLDEARPILVAARDARAILAAAAPSSTDLLRGLEISEEDLGALERRAGRLPAARAQWAKSVDIAERLLAEHPTNDRFRIDLVESRLGEADAAAQAGDRAAAEHAYGAARTLLAGVPADAGDGDELARMQIAAERGLAEAAVHRGALTEARALAESALGRAETMAAAKPDDPTTAEALARTLRLVAELDRNHAAAALARARAALEPFAAAGRLSAVQRDLLTELRRAAAR